MIGQVNAAIDSVRAQSATGVMMVRPASFGHNLQTSDTNRFQQAAAAGAQTAQAGASEFETLRQAVAGAGIGTCVIDDTPSPQKPDAVFPNNWISFHPDGTIVLYPMMAPNRRLERRMDAIDAVEARLHFRRQRLLDLSVYESEGRFLEGTGSLVLDHIGRIAYAARSARTDETLVREWAQSMGYEPLIFDAAGPDRTPIYHTNVLLSIGSTWAVVCSGAIADADRERVRRGLRRQRDVIEISPAVMLAFGANILELCDERADRAPVRVLMLSERAARAFEASPDQAWQRLCNAVDRVLPVAVPTIESVGGGGVRCMLAEVPQIRP
jgi:hypothetical protein